jgi:hypothetical protein
MQDLSKINNDDLLVQILMMVCADWLDVLTDETAPLLFRKTDELLRRLSLADKFKWRPISEAPRDGTKIIAILSSENKITFIDVICCKNEFWRNRSSDIIFDDLDYMYWMPLPPHPEDKEI